MNKVCLFGIDPDCPNLGVGALAYSLVTLFHESSPNARITIMCGAKESIVKDYHVGSHVVPVDVVNYRLSPRAKLHEHMAWILCMALIYRFLPIKKVRQWICLSVPWIRTLIEADFIGNIYGGDSFSDIYGLTRFVFCSLPGLTALLIGKRQVFLPQTYGPYQSWLARKIARFLLLHAREIYSRDQKGLEIVQEFFKLKDDKKKILFSPDVAFILPVVNPPCIEISPPMETNKHKCTLVGINISGLLFSKVSNPDCDPGATEKYKDLVIGLVQSLIRQPGLKVILIPHVGEQSAASDTSACEHIIRTVGDQEGHRLHIVRSWLNCCEIKSVIGRCDFFIGSRMHSCIAALSQGVPCIGIAYSRKFVGVFESVGAEDMVIDYRYGDNHELIKHCLNLIARSKTIRARLRESVPLAQQRIHKIFHHITRPSMSREQFTMEDKNKVLAKEM